MVLSIKMKNHTLLTKTMTKMAEESPFRAAYGYIAFIQEYPPPGGGGGKYQENDEPLCGKR